MYFYVYVSGFIYFCIMMYFNEVKRVKNYIMMFSESFVLLFVSVSFFFFFFFGGGAFLKI